MAATKKNTATTPKKPIAQVRAEFEALEEEHKKLQASGFCTMCNKHKPKNQFYVSSDLNMHSGITHICRKCAYNIACRADDEGETHEPTKASVMIALEYLDKPFLNKVWDASYFETNNSAKKNIWLAYIKNIQMPQYKNMRWRDSDIFKRNQVIGIMDDALPSCLEQEELEKARLAKLETQKEFEINRADVIKAIGYDPFSDYPNEDDKPMLYGSLISFIDEETKGDGMKMRAVIQIVKTFNQIEKINNQLDNYVNDRSELYNNIGNLDKLAAVVDKFIRSANALAKDNGIEIYSSHVK